MLICHKTQINKQDILGTAEEVNTNTWAMFSSGLLHHCLTNSKKFHSTLICTQNVDKGLVKSNDWNGLMTRKENGQASEVPVA